MRFFGLTDVLCGGWSMSSPPPNLLEPGYYWRSGIGSPDLLDPTPANFTQATTKFSDGSTFDHTTFEEIARPSNGSTNFIQALYVHESEAPLASYSASVFYGAGTVVTAWYWDGSAWQAWSPPGWGLNIFASAWFDLTRNPADQTTQFVLLSAETTGDGVDLESVRIGDFRVVAV